MVVRIAAFQRGVKGPWKDKAECWGRESDKICFEQIRKYAKCHTAFLKATIYLYLTFTICSNSNACD